MLDIVDDERSEKLRSIQHDLFSRNVPVLVLIEGCGGKVMGRLVNEVINILEPRGVEYHHFIPDVGLKGPRNAMRFIENSPAQGRFSLYDRGWYSQLLETVRRYPERMEKGLEEIVSLERFLTDNGTLLVKIYLNSTEDLDDALGSPDIDCGDLSDDAVFQNDYNARGGLMTSVLRDTDRINAEWDLIDVDDMMETVGSIVDVLLRRLVVEPVPQKPDSDKTEYPNPRSKADLSLKLKKDYSDTLTGISKELGELQCRLVKSKRSAVILFEGWDAGGKGGSIKRLSRALNPRGYHAVPIGVPTSEEASHNYLWRFCDDLPRDGRITIFDRSWYGRMMVEPVEGLSSEDEYERSSTEINDFERTLIESGAILIKFWMEISKEEQLKRFEERKEDPMKSWKLTDDDWNNRSKWDVYEEYVNRMMILTNTEYAPWTVVESEDKKYGRIKVIQTVIDVLEKELG